MTAHRPHPGNVFSGYKIRMTEVYGLSQATNYYNLPIEIRQHIFSFSYLETLMDCVVHLDKQHREWVKIILKNYTLTLADRNNGRWWTHITEQNTSFLYTFLKTQCSKIQSNTLNLSTINQQPPAPQTIVAWDSYLIGIVNNSIKHNNLYLFSVILKNQWMFQSLSIFNFKSAKWWEGPSIKLLLQFTIKSIEYNALNIIKTIFGPGTSCLNLNDAFDHTKIEESAFYNHMYYVLAQKIILFNNVNIMTYFESIYKTNYTNDQYISLLLLCSTNQSIDTAIKDEKTNILNHILSKITDLTTITDQTITTFINNALQQNMIYNILYLLTKLNKYVSIDNYTNILNYVITSKNISILPLPGSLNNLTIFTYIYTLYNNTHNINIPASIPLFTRVQLDENKQNLDIVVDIIKNSLLYKWFILSLEHNKKEIIIYLRNELIATCKKNQFTRADFITHIIVDCIAQTHNKVYFMFNQELYDLIINDFLILFTIEHITTIMNIVSINDYYNLPYDYFLAKFITKTIFNRQIYINLLKNNLLISLKSNNYNTVTEFILTKLKNAGETVNLNSPEYKDIFIDLIKKKNTKSVELFINNGFLMHTDDNNTLDATALACAIKTKSIPMIRLLITHGANVASNNYNVLHFALNQKSQTLAHFIKGKLQTDTQEQAYLEWETNPEIKAKYQALLVV